ncbi:MAG: septal ring lytic transglycosylase RlpA family protein [Pseudomonas stutzeri]|uniref:septal ring lytic transglycosylase RlpA family protein n=1 Tax=Stutzerimonas stutzeri TaxID=316 RepID=UPI0016B8D6DF|nr:septal ring lytic transglycosylase RlpA family protein [Stutzerimonas stutzeri]MDH0101556.1 septal ring lytic transglycosylase RlpA family protein [Stutzerimonas stutzeri]NIM32926.1 septal ring lytic transglycosylase RlpA family protein [Stutzerimonas stutzeri]NIM54695.1 septal ring lytic transglycosylase RlpA family protein [Stutzerimonas stutzeri]NIM88347.1 septal ring lytic transglycosylase RlpA family protein [Stutzerimonas stutzeri]NIN80032.1 septal ring lytic transglycosylase RlpA fam
MSPLWTRLVALGVTGALLASCSSTLAPSTTPSKSTTSSGPGDYARPHKDGAPWWDVDVSQIPDAVPMPHYGPYKANPYTVLGKTYFPISDGHRYSATGTASWYGTKFHGQPTANGEKYDLYGMSAAHKTLPLPTYVKVTNLDNGRTVTLRVNDRGPFYSDRIIDLSFAAAKKLGFAETGTARVKVEGIDPQQWWAAQGRPVPAMMAQPQMAASKPATSIAQPIEQYTPPPQQHAAATVPLEIDAKKNASPAASGLFLQVGAFANPDAAQLLKDKLSGVVSAPVFISSVVHNQQTLHRVRLGPIDTPDEAVQLEQSVRLANLGQPRRVAAD